MDSSNQRLFLWTRDAELWTVDFEGTSFPTRELRRKTATSMAWPDQGVPVTLIVMRFQILAALMLVACSRTGAPSFSSSPDEMRAWAQSALQEQLPQWTIEGGADPLVLTLNRGDQHLEVWLGRPYEYCRNNAGDCERMAGEYLAGVVQAAAESGATKPEPSQLVPAVRNRADVESYRERAEGILEEPIAGELFVVYMVDSPKSARVVDGKTVAELGLSPEQVKTRAFRNLGEQLPKLSTLIRPGDGQAIGEVRLDNYYTSSLLLPHSVWKDVARSFDDKLLVAVPAPDVLLYAQELSPSVVRALSARAHEVFTKSPRGTSATVLRWTAAGWTVAQEP